MGDRYAYHWLDREQDNGKVVSACQQLETFLRRFRPGMMFPGQKCCENCTVVLRNRANKGDSDAKRGLKAMAQYGQRRNAQVKL